MHIKTVSAIKDISEKQWNNLAGNSTPFVRHEFLTALERFNCVGEDYGWIPHHIAVFDDKNQLVGAIPLYFKDNSYGEFVFDWSWADAYQRMGMEYYPKMVVTSPYTPVTGPRLMVADTPNANAISALLIKTCLHIAENNNVSSLHWLFTSESDSETLEQHGFMRRLGYQFHWHNQNYSDFDEFLAQLTSKKRKALKRERRHVRESGIRINVLENKDIEEEHWEIFHKFYCSTFSRLGGYATLSLDFFIEIGKTMPDHVLLVLAKHKDDTIAGAFSMIGEQTLFGRHWGCNAKYDNLHFEACYYQGIDYCIKNHLARFEPGAQGEHKISRGFLPTRTYSNHWIRHPQFRGAINEFLHTERRGIELYIDELQSHSPFKTTNLPT